MGKKMETSTKRYCENAREVRWDARLHEARAFFAIVKQYCCDSSAVKLLWVPVPQFRTSLRICSVGSVDDVRLETTILHLVRYGYRYRSSLFVIQAKDCCFSAVNTDGTFV